MASYPESHLNGLSWWLHEFASQITPTLGAISSIVMSKNVIVDKAHKICAVLHLWLGYHGNTHS